MYFRFKTGDFFKIDRKGTTFCAHSQILCTKTVGMCTIWLFCAKNMVCYEVNCSFYCLYLKRNNCHNFKVVKIFPFP